MEVIRNPTNTNDSELIKCVNLNIKHSFYRRAWGGVVVKALHY